jgi:hypothetical protein
MKCAAYITADNVHGVNTWLFCYEMSPPGSRRKEFYEKILREFVASKRLAASLQAIAPNPSP